MSYSKHIDLQLFPEQVKTEQDYSATFAANMSLPIHRWYRYTAGFSAVWANQLIREQKLLGRAHIIDPFAGSGTIVLEGAFEGVDSIGIEAHPYIFKIAKAKLAWQYPLEKFKELSHKFLETAKRKTKKQLQYPKLIMTCYPEETLRKLDALKRTWQELDQEVEMRDFTWFIITSILRITSPVGTAQWQYILPSKTKAKTVDPFAAFDSKVNEMYLDMKKVQSRTIEQSVVAVFNEDAREIKSIPQGWGDLVITSPPYANNYDYADATRLEMTFWGDIAGWTDLQESVRKNLVRACTQHVSKLGAEINSVLESPRLKAILPELLPVFENLMTERLKHGGKKNYHLMIAAYFKDLADVFHSLRRVTSKDCLMCFVIGDSAPYGVYVPVDKWLGDLAISAGFESYTFEKLRDRNVKWKNRKHRVPLQEGRLWIKG